LISCTADNGTAFGAVVLLGLAYLTVANTFAVLRLLPMTAREKDTVSGGRPEKHPRRDIVDAVLHVVRTGCAWRQPPADFPPWQTVYWYFVRWEEQRVTLLTSSASRQIRRNSSSFHAGGQSSGPWRGSPHTGGWPATTNVTPPPAKP
jgi:hypothetical protein